MSEPASTKTKPANLLESLALEAWNELRPGFGVPTRIDVLKGRREPGRRGAYRLAGAGPDGAAVIAKRCRAAKACVEHAIYSEVLPHVPLPALRYYGSVEDKDGAFCWLFLEDVGEKRYSSADEKHRRLAGRWLGTLHTAAAGLAPLARLPDRGPGHYLERMQLARSRILANLANPAFKAADVAVLETILARCAALEAHWHRVEQFCEGLRRTVVHGDFAAKNLRVRTRTIGIDLLAFDWSNAGWGVPAVDLAQSTLSLSRFAADPDLPSYWEVVRDHWPALDLTAIQEWGRLATLFRLLAAVAWVAPSLGQERIDKTMEILRFYQTALDRAAQAVGWLA